jgi:hypothetical protein
MPTTITFVRRDATPLSDEVLSLAKSPDLVVVTAFSAIGLLLAMALTIFLPLSNAALVASVT